MKSIRRSIGLLLLADGIRALVAPEAYARKLQTGTPLLDDVLDYLAENRRFTLGFAASEITLGLWLAVR